MFSSQLVMPRDRASAPSFFSKSAMRPPDFT
jgi:hypothetical protein